MTETHPPSESYGKIPRMIDPDDVARRWVAWTEQGDEKWVDLFATDFHDHVSGRGREIWAVVRLWMEQSFADLRCEVHAAMLRDDRVMLWMTVHARHIASAFPWMGGHPGTGAEITWSQLHVLRFEDGLAREHWAVRGDLQTLQQIEAATQH